MRPAFTMRNTLLLIALTLTLGSCSNSDEPSGEPLSINEITAEITTEARAYNTSWDRGDKIGVTTLRGSDSHYVNLEYTTAQGDGVFTGTTIYFQDATAEVSFFGYYPFTGSEGTAPGVVDATTSAANQAGDSQKKIDFLWAKTSTRQTNPKVKFEFTHEMSKLTFTFKNGDDTDVSLIKAYTVKGLRLAGTFDTASGKATAKASAATEDLTIDVTSSVQSGVTLPSLILFPQDIDGVVDLEVENDDQTFSVELPISGKFVQGYEYQYNVTLQKTGLSVETSSITPWVVNGGKPTDVNATL